METQYNRQRHLMLVERYFNYRKKNRFYFIDTELYS